MGLHSRHSLRSFRRHAAGALAGALRFALRGFRCRAKRLGRGRDSPFHQVAFAQDYAARRLVFVLIAVIIVPFGTAFWGAAFTISNHFGTHYWVEWRNLGISNGVTAVVLVPALLLAVNRLSGRGGRVTRARMIEGSLLALGIVMVGAFVFAIVPAGPGTSPALLYAPIPLLIWAALRFGLGGISAAMLVVTFQAIWGAMHGRGPFLLQSPAENALALQMFLIVTGTPLMFLTVVLEDEKRSLHALHEVEKDARRHREQINLLSRVSLLGEMTASLAHELDSAALGHHY